MHDFFMPKLLYKIKYMKKVLTLISIFVCFSNLLVQAASYPTNSYGSENSLGQIYETETETNSNNLLEATYIFNSGSGDDFEDTGDTYGGSPLYQLTGGGILAIDDSITVFSSGITYGIDIFSGTDYFFIDDNGGSQPALGATEPLFTNPIPIGDNYLYFLSLIGIYVAYKLQRRNIFNKKELV